jgi:hypothetical protein
MTRWTTTPRWTWARMSGICFSHSSVAGASNLCRSTVKTWPFSSYSHASYSPAHKNLRMLVQTF